MLQEGEFERVGGTQTLKVDVRLVSATNRNLEEAVERGEFRADLYYRINVVSIPLPPLRDRPDDVTLLAHEFLRRFNEENGTRKRLTNAALRLLQDCYFPGNVRELENCMRRTATLAHDDALIEADFACTHGACLSRPCGSRREAARGRRDARSSRSSRSRTEPRGVRPSRRRHAPTRCARTPADASMAAACRRPTGKA